MSEIKVNKISPRTACGTVTLGDSGDTFTIPSGATITNSGTASGFGATGAVSWDTSSIKTAGFTAVTGIGYFCNTTGGAFSVTLPLSPSAGDVVGVADYAKTWDTYNLTLLRNGSNIGGQAINSEINTEGLATTIVYVDASKGWIVTDSGLQSDVPGATYVAGTGGCITTCGNFKMHTFYGPGTFCVSCAGNAGGSNSIDYLVVGGGGGGGGDYGAGGGAGGYRESPGTASGCYTVSPLGAAPAAAIAVAVQGYPVAIGAGGNKGTRDSAGTCGASSGLDSITSAGGGKGGLQASPCCTLNGSPGGSGGGAAYSGSIGVGNTPPVSPPQGQSGGIGFPSGTGGHAAGGGGGAGAVGTGVPPGCNSASGPGGSGVGTAINLTTMPAPSPTPSAQIGTSGPSPSVRYFAGGGGGAGGGAPFPQPFVPGTGGTGGGGAGAPETIPGIGVGGTINTGGAGGGGNRANPTSCGGAGGSGIVVIRYKFQ